MSTKRKPPAEVRHEWKRTDKKTGRYECRHCEMWTANVPLYFDDVCPSRERRQGVDRRAAFSDPLVREQRDDQGKESK